MSEVAAQDLDLCSDTEEVDHTLQEDVLASQVNGLRLRRGRRRVGVEELVDAVPILMELGVGDDEREVHVVEQDGACSEVVLVRRVLEVVAELVLGIFEAEVKVTERGALDKNARVELRVVGGEESGDFLVERVAEGEIEEILLLLEVGRAGCELKHLLLQVADHSSTARDVVEGGATDGDQSALGGHLHHIRIQPKCVLELAVENGEGLGLLQVPYGGVVVERNEGVGNRESAVVRAHHRERAEAARERDELSIRVYFAQAFSGRSAGPVGNSGIC